MLFQIIFASNTLTLKGIGARHRWKYSLLLS